jgi:hypothetical protein
MADRVGAASRFAVVLVQCGERLFYPGNRIVKVSPQPRLDGNRARRAAVIRVRIQATVIRRAPQVMSRSPAGGAA